MKGKNILRKINRGIVLGVVLLIGLVIFLVIDEQNFQRQQPEIQKMVEQYLQDVSEISLFPEQYRKIGQEVPAQVVEEKKKEMEDILNQYWVRQTGSVNYQNWESLSIEWNDMIDQNGKGNGYISDWSGMAMGNVKISKTGPGAAKVVFPYSVVVEVHGVAESNTLTGCLYIDPKNSSEPISEEEKQEVQTYSASGEFQVDMIQVNGVWKFVEAYDSYVSSAVPVE